MSNRQLISLHGGHSGEFCLHAQNTLAEIIEAYETRAFSWVGITEHMPPPDDKFLDPDQRAAGLTAKDLYERFNCYIRKCRKLQEIYTARIPIFVAFETEVYGGSFSFAQDLAEKFNPDFVVGSVHHVGDINFDFDKTHYLNVIRAVGGIDALYHQYFDIQLEMITGLRPQVVGHFDLIRLFDPEYRTRLNQPEIVRRIERNLTAVKDLGLSLDLNMRALKKGAPEPYPSLPILEKAFDMNIPVIPGDDSHGVDTVGEHIGEAVDLLYKMGFNTRWEEILKKIDIRHRIMNEKQGKS